MKTKHFEFIQFDFNNKEHLKLEKDIINSDYSNLISEDIDRFIRRNLTLHKENDITNIYIIRYKDNLVGLAFVNYHGEITIEGKHYNDEIEIGCGLHPNYIGKNLGSIIEYELADMELKLHPEFSFIVARIDDNNIRSIKAANKAGFIHTKDDEYIYKRGDTIG